MEVPLRSRVADARFAATAVAVIVTGVVGTGCGGKSGLDVPPSGVDAAVLDGGIDGGARDGAGPDAAPIDASFDAISPRDAGPIVCPEAPEIGFRVVPLSPLALGFTSDHFSLGGDGSVVYLAAFETWPVAVVHLFEVRGTEMQEVGSFDRTEGAIGAMLSVQDGVARMIGVDGSDVVLVEARDGVASVVGRSFVFHGTRLVPIERPVWNGEDVIVGGATGFVGALAIGAESPAWMDEGPLAGIAAQPGTGITEILRGTTSYRVHTFDRDGTPRAPADGVALDTAELWSGPAFGWLDDGTDQPIVLAGIRMEADAPRAVLERFRLDGTRGGGFSAPVSSPFGEVDLTTVAVPPHAAGYGMVVSVWPEPAIFHGATEAFVGDARDLPFACGQIAIAAGPCGYLVGCRGEDASTLELALVIPAAPR